MVNERASRDVWIQNGLPSLAPDTMIPTDRIKERATAIAVVAEILRLHPDITYLHYIRYHYDGDSEFDFGSVPIGVDVRKVSLDWFRLWSSMTVMESKKRYYVDSEPLEQFDGFALCSRVQMKKGERAHIPMLDMASYLEWEFEEDLVDIRLALKPQKGYLLETDYSTHFYGINLMSDQEWERYMRRLATKPEIDQGFIDASLKRGYAALRLFTYPPHKTIEPSVIEVIDQ